ncbi:retrotransposon protein [Hordeum vulgare]|nr:retrotransposon protein [Hordeum vulgare]
MALVPYSGGSGTTMATSVPMLTGANYTTWAIKVEADLDAAGLWEVVVSPEEAASAVIAKDKPARAYLLRALADDLLLQVASKKTAAEIWASLQTRFVGADRIRAARLGTLRGEFELLRMAEAETLDAFAGRLGGMAARYAALGSTLEDSALVKKLLDSVPDRLYAAVAGIKQFCDVSTMLFEDALGRLKAFDERLQRRGQTGGEREDGQLMLTAEQWRARERDEVVGETTTTTATAWRPTSGRTAAVAATTPMSGDTSRGTARIGGRGQRRRNMRCSETSTSRTPACSEPRLRARLLGHKPRRGVERAGRVYGHVPDTVDASGPRR